MRVIALLQTYNEARYIQTCLSHLIDQGVEVYLVDESSTDGTPALAEPFLSRGLIAIEQMPRYGKMSLQRQLERKEELALSLDADWFMHVDADEIRLAADTTKSLHDGLVEADRHGYNAVNFQEFTFVPTLESPQHDHPQFLDTMKSYYPFLPRFPHRMNAWKKQSRRVDLSTHGGHQVVFPAIKLYPVSFLMRHYMYLSVEHAIEKYVTKSYDLDEVNRGWHGARAGLQANQVRLTSQRELREYCGDDRLDATDPRTEHVLFSELQGIA